MPATYLNLIASCVGAVMSLAEPTVTPARLEGKYKAIAACWVFGFGSLIPWNSVLTMGDYYSKLFGKYHPTRSLTLIYQPFGLGAMAILTYNESKINTRKRIISGYIIFFASSLAVLLLDLATSGKGGLGPFVGVSMFVALFGVAEALAQGGIVGEISFMCPEFMQSFFAGLAASGALTSGLRLVTKAAFKNAEDGLRKGIMLFLAICTVFELLCILLYAFYLPKLPIVKYFRSKAALEGSKTVSADLAVAGIQTKSGQVEDEADQQERLSTKQLFFRNIDYEIALFLTYVLTLSIFPGFLYENTGQHQLGEWYALVLIASYSLLDLVARYIPLVNCLKLESRKGLIIATLSRFLLVPAFYFTAKYADQGWMIFLTSFLGLTNGYLTVCIMTVAPKGFKGPEQNAVGNIMMLCLVVGITAGVTLDWLWLIGKKDSF